MPQFCIGFYNAENFFDTGDSRSKNDDEFTPNGRKKWTEKRYFNKVLKISQTIRQLGVEETGAPPLFIGLAEIESAKVLQDLILSRHLDEFQYSYIHFDSLDERGIDTALLYRSNLVEPIKTEVIRLGFPQDNPTDFTRDTLYVQLRLGQFILHTYVLHLPSRRDEDVNRDFRNYILTKVREHLDRVFAENPDSFVVLMGDMNGNPDDEDAVQLLKTSASPTQKDELYNPMMNLKKHIGSLTHDGKWILYDQIIFSQNILAPQSPLHCVQAGVFKNKMIQDKDRRFSGFPFRTYVGNKYLGGYSDHFPVYAILNY